MQKQSWSVFVPCYNEGSVLRNVVDKIAAVMEAIAAEYEIMIVDDGSTDDSISVIKKIQAEKRNVSAVFHDGNKGIGAVQRRAYTSARFENVIVIGGDGQFNPEELLVHPVIKPGIWLAFYREQFPSYTPFRIFLSGVNKYLNQFLFGMKLKDVNWAMAFKTADLKLLDLRLNSTLIKSEICIKLHMLGHRAIEIPSTYHPRISGEAKGASFKIIMQAMMEIFRLLLEIQRFKKNLNTPYAPHNTRTS
ncbi:MAG TPA: glycosyltransferase family 2 protein [Chitinophagales bacterium]|nr:glycosyltransferase family 2 protein [Chitinophagales bacterium]